MFDVFYWGNKPNLFAFEKPAVDLDDAARQCKTLHYWFIYGGNDYTGFDFDVTPAPWEADHVYVYPSQWQRNGGVYLANKNTIANRQWNFRTEQTVTRLPNKELWHTPANINKEAFDYSWHPDPLEQLYEYHFPTQWQASGGPTYYGTAGIKLVTDQTAVATVDKSNWIIPSNIDDSDFDYSWHPDPLEQLYEYHFPTQWQSAGGPVYRGTAGVKLEYRQRVTAVPDMTRWRIPEGIDDTEFDYSWHPNPLEPDYEYHFPTQHQRDGGPVYCGNAGIKYINAQRIRANSTQIFYMDFLNPESDTQFKLLQKEYPDIKRTRYVSDHLNVFKRIMNMATTEFVWIISSICNYDFFDFTWHPPEEQREMIHCFASNHEKRGDTFRIHVPSFTQQMVELELLDWFNVINYVDHSIPRFSIPKHIYDGDNLISEIKQYDFKTPYVTFTNQKDMHLNISTCIWSQKDRVAIRITRSGGTTIVPRDAKEYITTQLYDYPYLEKKEYLKKAEYYGDNTHIGMDIVYISNGEPDEAKWYEHLVYASNYDTVHWVQGVNGRTAAYQEAARRSTTPWFFAVFAKLEVELDFPWFEWMPDYWQEPKHYIFNARNPVNGLEYGHQGMIAYNKRLVLENNNPGIDFTLSQPHESVQLLSGTAHFNQDSWMTWRTAFREVLKLKHFMAIQPTLETEHRLNTWCTHAIGNYSNYCLDGARDAVVYYDEVNGDPDKLQLSFEWQWLRTRYDTKTPPPN
jgi:hypothetical protein